MTASPYRPSVNQDRERSTVMDAEAYYDERAMAWRCAGCDAVIKADGDCPRCDS